MNVILSKNNFYSGVIAKNYRGQYNSELYENSLSHCNNFNIDKADLLKRRPGTKYSVDSFGSFNIEFIFNNTQTYILQFVENKIYFLRRINGELDYIKNGNTIYSIASPYTLNDAKKLKYTQNADTLILTHPQYQPRQLIRTSANTFTLEQMTFYNQAQEVIDPFNANGSPSSCLFYENRLFFAGITNQPTFIYFSDSGQYDHFTLNAAEYDDLNGGYFDLAFAKTNIDWLVAGENSIIAGTSEGVVAINGGNDGRPITSTSILSRPIESNGSVSLEPVLVGNNFLFVENTARQVRVLRYDLLAQRYDTPSLNTLNIDITESGIKRIQYNRDKNGYVYVLLNNGTMLVVNLVLQEQGSINAWTSFGLEKYNIADMVTLPLDTGETKLYLLTNENNTDDYYMFELGE